MIPSIRDIRPYEDIAKMVMLRLARYIVGDTIVYQNELTRNMLSLSDPVGANYVKDLMCRSTINKVKRDLIIFGHLVP